MRYGKRSARKHSLEVSAPLRVGGSEGSLWVFRSDYERREALRLLDNGVYFTYEDEQMAYMDSVYNGKCLRCGSTHVVSARLYTPDFYFPETDIFVETKGKFDQESRRKMKNVCTQSDRDIRMVFMRDNYLSKKKSMTYGRWCELNGIQYAVGSIPLEWCKKDV